MTAINTNTAALNAQYYLKKTNQEMESAMARLSSGSKVNSAADDAAGLAVGNKMAASIRSYEMGVRNSLDMINLLFNLTKITFDITKIKILHSNINLNLIILTKLLKSICTHNLR